MVKVFIIAILRIPAIKSLKVVHKLDINDLLQHRSPEKKPGTTTQHLPISTNLKTVTFSKEADEDQMSPEIRALFENVQIWYAIFFNLSSFIITLHPFS